MSKIVFHKLILLSIREKAAQQFIFDEKATVIWSVENKTGKSSVLKSLYYTLGVDTTFDPEWERAGVINFLFFSIDSQAYTMVRDKKVFLLFDSEKNLIGSWSKVGDLATDFSELIGYKFTLTDRYENEVTPPPAYFFLPFYIDQDKSWYKSWNSFNNLTQFSKWEEVTVKYHLGILTDEYFDILKNINGKRTAIKELKISTKSLEYAIHKYSKDLRGNSFRIDTEEFRADMENLVGSIEELQRAQDEYKSRLVMLYNDQLLLKSQKAAIENTLRGIEVDYETLQIPCSSCGSVHDSSFEARLKTAENEARCYQLLSEVSYKLNIVEEAITKEHQNYELSVESISNLHETLNKKKGELKLQDILRLQGIRDFVESMKADLWDEIRKMKDIENDISRLEKQKKKIIGKKRVDEIKGVFNNTMEHYLHLLNLNKVDPKHYKNLQNKIKLQGSDTPRAILAYFYSVLFTKSEKATSPFCPIVIDSPKQQDQSDENYRRILEVIFHHRPQNTQLIVGLIDKPDIQFEGSIIKLEKQYKVLDETQFEQLFSEVRVFLANSLLG